MIYSSWDIEQNILKLVILGHFLPFYHPKNPKNQNFEKWKNLLEISSFYTFVPKITIIWFRVPEIQSETDRIFCHFGFWAIFCPSPPFPLMILNNDPENQHFEKKKKMPGDIIFLYLHVCHKWKSYDIWFLKYKVRQTKIFVISGHFDIMYGSWDMECKWQNFLSFWTIFCPFNPLWTQKIKLLKKWRTLEDIILQMMQLMIALLSRTTIMQGKWD